jgi:hypothetical protein
MALSADQKTARSQRWVEMYWQGMNFSQIGDVDGISRSVVSRTVREALNLKSAPLVPKAALPARLVECPVCEVASGVLCDRASGGYHKLRKILGDGGVVTDEQVQASRRERRRALDGSVVPDVPWREAALMARRKLAA